MNKDKLIKISNIIGLTAIIALVYWVFIFIIITVFGLKIFRENITESFYLSLIGILALMFGALMINIMFNMTKISEYVSRNSNTSYVKKNRLSKWILIVSFPLIFGLLFMGDYISSHKKERMIIKAADYLTQTYKTKIDLLMNYEFNEDYIKNSNEIIDLISKADESIQQLNIIVADTIDGESVYMIVGDIYIGNNGLGKKTTYIYKCSKVEKEYLNKVFNSDFKDIRFDSSDGNYELYYPIKNGTKTIILYYSERQRYGKIGS
jgi:hypothetical protein